MSVQKRIFITVLITIFDQSGTNYFGYQNIKKYVSDDSPNCTFKEINTLNIQ